MVASFSVNTQPSIVKSPADLIAEPISVLPWAKVIFIKVTIESALIDLIIDAESSPSKIVPPFESPIIVRDPL